MPKQFYPFLLFLLTICFSCNKNEKIKTKEKYKILNLVYHHFSNDLLDSFVLRQTPRKKVKHIDYKRFSTDKKYSDSIYNLMYNKDSLAKTRKRLKNNKLLYQKRFVIETKMSRYHNLKEKNHLKIPNDFTNLYKNFVAFKEYDSLDIYKLISINNDSLIKFHKQLLEKQLPRPDFYTFDVIVSFSDIIFNKSYSKAIIIGTTTFSRTNSHADIIFLEEKNKKWKIVNSQPL